MELKRNEKDMLEDGVVMLLQASNDECLQLAIKNCPDKDFTPCKNYITAKAKDFLNGTSGAVRDDVVFEWAKEYFIDYDVRKQKEAELKKENEAKALKQRIADTLTSVRNQAETLKNNPEYKELQEKYKLDLLTWENELKMELVKDNKRVDEINSGLASIIDEIDKLRKPVKEVKAEEEKEEESFGGLFDIEL